MSEDNGGGDLASGGMVPPHHSMPHYHGDAVRALFVIGAILVIVAQSTGADLPLSTPGAVISAVLLVIAAGITNPAVIWIHWVNSFFAVYGTLLFGMTAVAHYRSGVSIFEPTFFYIEGIALLSLMALYFTTRTIRGMSLRKNIS
ncbi:MAG: hypothetical protein WCS97_01730 [Candidatus Paceibacterota bacterium]|jgi:hypothetical protein